MKYFYLFLAINFGFFNSKINAQTVSDIDGNIYNTVNIGTQVWMKENLKTTKYRDGSSIPNITDNTAWLNLTSGAYCDYNNIPSNSNTYGRLYNWYVVSDSRQLCPTDWHVANDYDWTILETYLIANGFNYDGTTSGNKIAKSLATITNWFSSTTAGAVGNTDYPANRNATGFSAFPCGYRTAGVSSVFSDMGGRATWWSSTQGANDWSPCRIINYYTSYFNNGSSDWNVGNSVRCIRDLANNIEKLNNIEKINIYPNPANDKIEIEGLRNCEIDLINMQGQIVKALKMSENKSIINVSKLPNGVYTVRIKYDNEIIVKKIIKQ